MRRGRKRPFRARGQYRMTLSFFANLRPVGGTADGADSTSLYEIDFTGRQLDTGG